MRIAWVMARGLAVMVGAALVVAAAAGGALAQSGAQGGAQGGPGADGPPAEPVPGFVRLFAKPHHGDVSERYRLYERKPERPWHLERPADAKPVYVPRRWVRHDAPHHRHLQGRPFGRIWYCERDCNIAFLFDFTVWPADEVLSERSVYAWPVWDALEYNRTNETSLWESSWGYTEFTVSRTYTRQFRRGPRPCRDFTRFVVRYNGLGLGYTGTACRNNYGEWWIAR